MQEFLITVDKWSLIVTLHTLYIDSHPLGV